MVTVLKTDIKDIMSERVITIQEDMPFSQAMRMFSEIDKHYLPVVNNQKELIGIFSAKDALRAINRVVFNELITDESEMNDTVKVTDIMTDNEIYFLNHDDTIERAMILFKEFRIGVIPVLDGHKIVGQVSIHDLVDAVQSVTV